MNLVIKIESLFDFEHANITANIFTIITPAKEAVNFSKRSITKRYNKNLFAVKYLCSKPKNDSILFDQIRRVKFLTRRITKR
jgi:hypothetical protein